MPSPMAFPSCISNNVRLQWSYSSSSCFVLLQSGTSSPSIHHPLVSPNPAPHHDHNPYHLYVTSCIDAMNSLHVGFRPVLSPSQRTLGALWLSRDLSVSYAVSSVVAPGLPSSPPTSQQLGGCFSCSRVGGSSTFQGHGKRLKIATQMNVANPIRLVAQDIELRCMGKAMEGYGRGYY